MSGAWDGTRVLRCERGPWHGQERVWQGQNLEVAGHREGRYVAFPDRDPRVLVWSTTPVRPAR